MSDKIYYSHDIGFPPTLDEFREWAQELVDQEYYVRKIEGLALANSYAHRLVINPNRLYLDQHPELRLKYQRALDNARVDESKNPFIVQNWLNYLKEVLENHDIRIEDNSNVNERSFILGMTLGEDLILPGSKYSCFFQTHARTREWATVIGTFSCAGRHVPPYIFLKGKRISTRLKDNVPLNTLAG